MKRLSLALSLLALVSSIACSKGGQLTLERGPGGFMLQQVSGAEFTNSSAQYSTTLLNGYKVQQSVGDWLPEVEQTSLMNGYKYYSTVQGQIVSTQ
jgi:hypothetical protein